MPTYYPDQIHAILRACVAYRDHEIELADLKSALWIGVESIVAAEEAEFRRYLQCAEGRLDMIEFTEEDARSAAIEIVLEIESRIREHIK